jgi:hypothetical protein
MEDINGASVNGWFASGVFQAHSSSLNYNVGVFILNSIQ